MQLPLRTQQQIDNAEYPLGNGEIVFNVDTKRIVVGDSATDLSELKNIEEPDFATVQTTNATATTIVTITPDDDTCGLIELSVYGGDQAASGVLVGRRVVAYKKESGTISVLSTTTIITNVGGLAASWTTGTGTGTITVIVTGVAATTINWKCYYKVLSLNHIVLV